MINKEIELAINKQINAEIYSSYLYYGMSFYYNTLSLNGFSHWMRVQALEELTHVQKFSQYIDERGGKVKLLPVKAPPSTWKSPLIAFTSVYKHEVKVTKMINDLMDLALSKSDHASVSFLSWFVDEQVEEESHVDDIVQKLKMVEKTEGGIFMLNQELDKRTFVQPPELTGVF